MTPDGPARARWRRRHWPLALWALAGGVAAAAPVLQGSVVALPRLALLDGSVLDPADLRDTALVLVFFDTGCAYCRRHNARMEQLARATRGLPLRVLGAAGDRDADTVRGYLRQQGLGFGVTLDDGRLRALLTPRRVVPMTAVLDRAGRLRELIPGEMAEDDVLGLARWARAG